MALLAECPPVIDSKTQLWKERKRFYMVSVEVSPMLTTESAGIVISNEHRFSPEFVLCAMLYPISFLRVSTSPIWILRTKNPRFGFTL